MNPYFSQAAIYLIQVVIGFYVLAVLLRFLFQWVRADFYNPISQFLVVVTNPPLKILRRVIPGLFGIDLASLVLLVVLKFIEIYLITAIRGVTPALPGVLVLAGAQILEMIVYVFIITILIRVVLSWVNPYGMQRNPMTDLLYSLTEPVLSRARRLIPPFGGLDLSPIAVFVLLELSLILLIQPLKDVGLALMMS